MDYKVLYEQALERAKKLQETCDSMAVVGWCEYIFPELKEPEDERIRKELIAFIKKRDRSGCDYDYDKWIAWLEKQGHMLDADKVIEWLMENVPMFWEVPCSPNRIIDKFKGDFEI